MAGWKGQTAAWNPAEWPVDRSGGDGYNVTEVLRGFAPARSFPPPRVSRTGGSTVWFGMVAGYRRASPWPHRRSRFPQSTGVLYAGSPCC